MNKKIMILLITIFNGLNIYSATKIQTEATSKEKAKELIKQIKLGNLAGVQKLISKGIDVNQPAGNYNWEIPLIAAIDNVVEDILNPKYYDDPLSRGPDKYFDNINGIEIVKTILNANANLTQILPNILDTSHSSYPNNEKGTLRLLEVIQLLLSRGAKINEVNKDNDTLLTKILTKVGRNSPYMFDAEQVKQVEKIIKFLLANGADVNHIGQIGKEPINIIPYYMNTKYEAPRFVSLKKVQQIIEEQVRKDEVLKETKQHLPLDLAKIVTEYDILEEPKEESTIFPAGQDTTRAPFGFGLDYGDQFVFGS